MSLDDRIHILEEQKYKFNHSLFTNILQVHHREINKEFGYFIKKIDNDTEHNDTEYEESLNIFTDLLDISQDTEEETVDILIKKLQSNILSYYNMNSNEALDKLQHILEFINIEFFDDNNDDTTLTNKVILINRINRLLVSIVPSNILNVFVNKSKDN